MLETRLGGVDRRTVLGGITLTALAARAGTGQAAAPAGPPRWWTSDYRIVQTNLREIDARENPREIARAVKDFGGTAIVSNIGGIVAFYPTRLEYQYRNPYLRNDFVREMIDASHAEGLAYLGRFDTAKALKKVYDAHPDWFSIYRDGQPTEYAGTYQACPNGAWLQDYSLRMLREALTAYKPDGVFFNGIGFGVNDYGLRNRGFCVCNNCRSRFRQMYGLELPAKYDFSDPNYRPYLQFQERVTGDLFARMHKLADELIPGVPIFRGDDYEQVGRGELQRRVSRPAPEWQYQSGEQIRAATARNPGKPFSSTSTAHVDYPWRETTETADYHLARFAQQIANGGRLDLYLMGTLADQRDQSYLPPLSMLYHWQAANAVHYTRLSPVARVGLWSSQANDRFAAASPWSRYGAASARGAYAMLVDSRLPFHFVSAERVADGTTSLAGFDAILLPHVLCIADKEASALDAFVAGGGLLVVSGMTAALTADGRPRATMPLAAFPLASYGAPEKVEGWALDSARGRLKHSANPTPVDGTYFGGPLRGGTTDLVPFLPDVPWGPPEYSFVAPDAKARTVPGVALRAHGKGHAVHIPWPNEWQYYRDGLPVNQALLASIVARYAPPQPFVLEGPGAVELAAMRSGDRNLLLHVINYAGQRNGRYDPAPPLHGLRLGVRPGHSAARSLVTGQALQPAAQPGAAGYRWYDLAPVGAFDAILLEA